MLSAETIYGRLAEGFSNPTIQKAHELMEIARFFKKVKSASPAGITLEASTNEKAIVFSDAPYEKMKDQKIHFLPLYFIAFLMNKKPFY